jgi:hypothetical protein
MKSLLIVLFVTLFYDFGGPSHETVMQSETYGVQQFHRPFYTHMFSVDRRGGGSQASIYSLGHKPTVL